MLQYLIPDLMLDDFAAVTPELLRSLGIRALLCDIDNTLATYEQRDPPPAVQSWCAALTASGIRIAFISNNNGVRVTRFNLPFGYPAYSESGKPSRKALRAAMSEMHVSPAETAVLGDQLLTDVLAAKRMRLRAIVVKPIKDRTTLFFKCKRLLEKPFIRIYQRRHSK